jgi:hypothetical protein
MWWVWDLKITKNRDSMENVLLKLVKQNLPKTFHLTGISDLETEKKTSDYIKRINELSPDYILERPHCLFDWILFASTGDKKAISFLNYIDNQCSSLLETVEPRFRNQISGVIRNMLFTMDAASIQPNNPAYMNFLGEIIGLMYLLNSSNNNYQLVEIEGSLLNGKSADFVFRNKESGELIYIEFVSYHNIDPNKIESDEEFIKFLEKKFDDKISYKTENLDSEGNLLTISGEKVPFAILPIIWTEIIDLLPFKKAFEKLDSKYANVFQCCSLHVQDIEDGSFVYTFSTVNNILESWKSKDRIA